MDIKFFEYHTLFASQPPSRVKCMVGQPASHALKTTVENLFIMQGQSQNSQQSIYKPELTPFSTRFPIDFVESITSQIIAEVICRRLCYGVQ